MPHRILNLLAEEVQLLQERVRLLDTRAREKEALSEVTSEALEELQTASEELRVAEEEIRSQSEQLAESRALLEQERLRYKDLFEFAPDAYLTTTANGQIMEANLAAGRLLRVTPERLAGKPIGVYVAEQDRRSFRTALLSLAHTGGEKRFRVNIVPRLGSPVAIDIRVSNSASGGPDQTLRWLLREAGETETERAARAITETHHRVKNNLQVIAAMMDMRLLEETPVFPREDLRRYSAAVRTLATMHDMLTHDAKSGGDSQTVDARALIDNLAPLLRLVAGTRQLQAHCEDDINLTARQATALALILNELVSNAMKHGRTSVEIKLSRVDRHLQMVVVDDGDGFPPGFDADTAANTGLELVNNLGRWDLSGQVTFGNREGSGGAVTVRFPAAE